MKADEEGARVGLNQFWMFSESFHVSHKSFIVSVVKTQSSHEPRGRTIQTYIYPLIQELEPFAPPKQLQLPPGWSAGAGCGGKKEEGWRKRERPRGHLRALPEEVASNLGWRESLSLLHGCPIALLLQQARPGREKGCMACRYIWPAVPSSSRERLLWAGWGSRELCSVAHHSSLQLWSV